MNGTRNHGHHRRGPAWEAPGGPMYWGWSPASGQMEMMDLRNYVDAMRAGYDQALEDLYDRLMAVPGYMAPGPQPFTMPVPPPYGRRPGKGRGKGRHGRHDHGDHQGHGGCGGGCDDDCGDCGEGRHHKDGGKDHGRHGDGHGHDHGCGKRRDCSCECCIVDADIVVYARCGEARVVPIEIENDTRKDREDVTLELSDVRSGGGNKLPWKAALNPTGPLTLKGCTTAEFELLVAIQCERDRTDDKDDDDRGDDDKVVDAQSAMPPATPAKRVVRAKETTPAAATGTQLRSAVNRRDTGDVDCCTVGYVTISVGGCLVRPIVVAIAVLPDHCGAYRAACACSSCC